MGPTSMNFSTRATRFIVFVPNGLAGKEVVTPWWSFTAEGFLMSFSLPNFYFHATTAYDILRSKGVPVGKMDFLGQLDIKT